MGGMLFLEGASGISGDMTVGALLDLGADAGKLDAVLKSLQLEGFDYEISRKACSRSNIYYTSALWHSYVFKKQKTV